MHAASCLEANVLAAQAVAERLEKELKAESEARLAALREKAELQMELEAEREASRAAAQKKVGTCQNPSFFDLLRGILSFLRP